MAQKESSITIPVRMVTSWWCDVQFYKIVFPNGYNSYAYVARLYCRLLATIQKQNLHIRLNLLARTGRKNTNDEYSMREKLAQL